MRSCRVSAIGRASGSPEIVIDRLLYRGWQLSHRYFLFVFILVHSRIDEGANCHEPMITAIAAIILLFI